MRVIGSVPTALLDDRRLRRAGQVILAGSALQLIAAFLPDSRVFTSPDPLLKTRAIAANKRGWVLQAILFPIAFLAVALGFRGVASVLPASAARSAALISSILGGLSFLLWLPISVGRLRVTSRVDAALEGHRSEPLPDMNNGQGWAFWPYTTLTLAAILAMGVALYRSGLRRRTGAVTAALSALSLMIIPLWRDWPPLFSYMITLVIGMGLNVDKSK